eukprot:EC787515.1.p1 GENE.EC787515.1~~EC787515.1.p1  ORF type:complete len:154 (+),score=8.90 EC787515.1:42-503(+)
MIYLRGRVYRGISNCLSVDYSRDDVSTYTNDGVARAGKKHYISNTQRVGYEARALVPVCILAISFFVGKNAFRICALRFFRRWQGEKKDRAKYDGSFRKLESRLMENSRYATNYTVVFSMAMWVFMTEEWTLFSISNIWAKWPVQLCRAAFLL